MPELGLWETRPITSLNIFFLCAFDIYFCQFVFFFSSLSFSFSFLKHLRGENSATETSTGTVDGLNFFCLDLSVIQRINISTTPVPREVEVWDAKQNTPTCLPSADDNVLGEQSCCCSRQHGMEGHQHVHLMQLKWPKPLHSDLEEKGVHPLEAHTHLCLADSGVSSWDYSEPHMKEEFGTNAPQTSQMFLWS